MAFVFVALTIVFTVLGQLLVKYGMLRVGGVPTNPAQWLAFFLSAVTNAHVLVGLALAGVASLCWMAAVSKLDLSLAYPFMSLAIVLVLVLSGALFGEHVPWTRWVGVAIVCVGIIVSAR